MRIINLNPDRDIGASSWFVDIEGSRLLMDAGVHPKRDGWGSLPLYDRIKNDEVDAIAISHCHHDHVGSLPIAQRYCPRAHVLMTELSYFVVERVLHNSVNVMKRQRDELGIKEYPLFTHEELDETAHLYQGFKYNREIDWGALHKVRAGLTSPTLEFYDAGHAIGSAGIMVRGQKETVFFTGDVCFQDQTILKAARFEDIQADVLIMETTRGNREVPPGMTRQTEADRLAEAIQRVLARKGSILIPAFALGRNQEILAQLCLLMRSGKIPRQPIYVGGLGKVFTEIYDLQAHRTHRLHTNLILTEALELIVLDQNQIDKMKIGGGKIFALTAGMMTEKTAAHEMALRMVGQEEHAIFFVGYADPDTPGGRLKRAKLGETFFFSQSGGELTRRCEIEDFDLTAHANRDDLMEFVGRVNPRTIFLGHGDDPSRRWFEQEIRKRFPKVKVHQPQPGIAVEA
jgi:Cft2 family RNA processing exonuclease